MKRSRVVPLIAAIVIGGLATATTIVRAGDEDVLGQAADALKRQGSYRSVLRVSASAGPSIGFVMDGVVDAKMRIARLSMRFATPLPGVTPATCTIVTTERTAYVAVPQARRSLFAGKAWVSSDVAGFLPIEGTPQELGTGRFENISDVRPLGTERLRGVMTTRYRGTLTLPKVTFRKIDPRFANAVPRTVPIEIWIGDDHLIRKIATSFNTSAANVSVRTDSEFEFFDFGIPVSVTLPPENDVQSGDAQRALAACLSRG